MDSIPQNQNTQPGTVATPPSQLLNPASNGLQPQHLSPAWLDLPLDALVDVRVDEMEPEELALFVKHCTSQRASAQTMKATLVKESVKHHGVEKKKSKKNSVDLAMELLNQHLAAKAKL